MKLTFPNKTAKQIVEACDNKTSTGKLLYDINWYEKEDFYTEEKCRPRTAKVSEIENYGKNWNECKDLIKKQGGEMLNFAEYVYFIQEYHKVNGKYPEENQLKWSWTSSRSSSGHLVFVGGCDPDGVCVNRDDPGYSNSNLGVRFFRGVVTSVAKARQAEADSGNLENAIAEVKKANYRIFKEI